METAYKYIRRNESCVGERSVLALKSRAGMEPVNKHRLYQRSMF